METGLGSPANATATAGRPTHTASDALASAAASAATDALASAAAAGLPTASAQGGTAASDANHGSSGSFPAASAAANTTRAVVTPAAIPPTPSVTDRMPEARTSSSAPPIAAFPASTRVIIDLRGSSDGLAEAESHPELGNGGRGAGGEGFDDDDGCWEERRGVSNTCALHGRFLISFNAPGRTVRTMQGEGSPVLATARKEQVFLQTMQKRA